MENKVEDARSLFYDKFEVKDGDENITLFNEFNKENVFFMNLIESDNETVDVSIIVASTHRYAKGVTKCLHVLSKSSAIQIRDFLNRFLDK